MEVYREELNELEKQIQKIYGMLDFEKADEFEERLEKIKSDLYSNSEEFSENQKYEASKKIAELNSEIWEYMIQEGNAKDAELNKKQNLRKLKDLIENANKKESEQILIELKQFINEIKDKSSSQIDLWQLNEMASEFLLIIFIKQAKNKETIDLSIIRELSIDKEFINAIQKELRKIAKNKDENEAYDIMLIAGNLDENNIDDLELWRILTEMEQVAFIEQEKTEILESDDKKKLQVIGDNSIVKFLDQILKKTTRYVFRELNEESGEYKTKVEYHRFPPSGSLLERCKKDLIELEINDVSVVKLFKFKRFQNAIAYSIYDFKNLEVLVFGKNVHKICREDCLVDNNGMPEVRKIIFEDDVQQIEKNVFYGLKNLTDVVIGSGMNYLGESCFQGCERLSNLKMKEGLQEINNSAFYECIALQDIYLPKSLTKIGNYAFCRSGLRNAELPNTNIKLGYGCFYYCNFLERVSIQNDKAKKELEIPECCFKSCCNLKEIPILGYTKKIGKEAFADTGIEELYIPDNVKDIEEKAFFNCDNLKEVIIGQGIDKILANWFKFCTKLREITHKGVTKKREKTTDEVIEKLDRRTTAQWQNLSQDSSPNPQEGPEL